MIIPQILENKTASGNLDIPEKCPVCGGKTEIRSSDDGVETLVCTEPSCAAKHIGRFEHFVQRDAMNIVGMSTATIETLVSEGCISCYRDFYHISDHKDKVTALEGFGEKSYSKLAEAIEASRHTELSRVLYAIGIPNIGRAASRLICAVYKTPDELPELTAEQLTAIDGIGDVLAGEYVRFFADKAQLEEYRELVSELDITEAAEADMQSGIAGKTFVITGSVMMWKNRNELKSFIEQNGGRVASSVSAKTDYLINNDSSSGSAKNKTAKSLGVSIITEEEFRSLLNE